MDRLERAYRRLYPTRLFLDNARQLVAALAAGLTVAAVILALQYALSAGTGKAPIEIEVYLVTAFASVFAIGYVSLWALTVRRVWIVGALVTFAVAILMGRALYHTALESAGPVAELVVKMAEAAPLSSALLLATLGLIAAYYAHFLFILLQAAYVLLSARPLDRAALRDLPRRHAQTGVLSRFWHFPPLFRFARRPRWRYAAIIVLSIACAVFFSFATAMPLILMAPIEDRRASLPPMSGRDRLRRARSFARLLSVRPAPCVHPHEPLCRLDGAVADTPPAALLAGDAPGGRYAPTGPLSTCLSRRSGAVAHAQARAAWASA
jgi:hypothetical protein